MLPDINHKNINPPRPVLVDATRTYKKGFKGLLVRTDGRKTDFKNAGILTTNSSNLKKSEYDTSVNTLPDIQRF